jgi:hypothetical protein
MFVEKSPYFLLKKLHLIFLNFDIFFLSKTPSTLIYEVGAPVYAWHTRAFGSPPFVNCALCGRRPGQSPLFPTFPSGPCPSTHFPHAHPGADRFWCFVTGALRIGTFMPAGHECANPPLSINSHQTTNLSSHCQSAVHNVTLTTQTHTTLMLTCTNRFAEK